MEAGKQPFQEENNNSNEKRNQNKIKKQEIQSAIAKAVELRGLHAALMQQQKQANSSNSPNAHLRFPSVLQSPSAHHNPHFSAQDYPVFTPSYEDEAVHFGIEDGNYNENGVVSGIHGGGDECNQSRKANTSSRKGFPCDSVLNLQAVAEEDDQRSFTSSYANANHPALLSASSPGPDFCKSKRNSLSEFRSVSSYSYNNNKCNNPASTCKNLVVPLTDLHSSSVHSQPKSKSHGKMSLLRFLPRLNKKKDKHSNSSDNRTDPDNDDDVSQSFKVFLSIEALKKELLEANEKRDTALTQVAEMRTSVGELSQKLEYLEKYCEDLKKALKLAAKTPQMVKKSAKEPKIDDEKGGILPVNEEVMIEGFIQMVSETRLSVKQFCKTLVDQIDETDTSLTDSLNFLLLPYKISLHKKFSKTVFYHLEAIINQSLYKDFENCVFQSNGTPKFLDPQQDREFQFSSFVALRNLSWNEVLTKGTKYYSEDLSKFCDQKMSLIIAAMNWTKPWPEQLLQAFFVTAKCIWLLHLLAFSFNPPLRILRVQENRSYDPHFMEDVAIDSHNSSRIKIMVMPGFYVHDRILRCQVLCRYKSVK